MRLLRKTLLYLLLVAVPVALGGVWLFDTLISRVIRYEMDEQLTSDLAYTQQQLQMARTQSNRTEYLLSDPHIVLQPAKRFVAPTFSDTVEVDRRENEPVPVRRLTASVKVGDRTYLIVVKQAMGEFEEIARMLSVGVIVAFLALVVFLTVLNSWVARRLWQPFYQLIDQLRAYRLDNRRAMTFTASEVEEFNQLSLALNDMSLTIHQQYVVQKEFTDHAAHEMQTPLAVIMTHVDQLLGTEPLTEKQVNLMEQTHRAVRRLVQLNKSLLLLSKIENNQFSDRQRINVSELINQLHHQFTPYAEHRGLSWSVDIEPKVIRLMNPHLAEVLFSNLLKNALIHSLPNTSVKISLTKTHFFVMNVGLPLPFPAERLFDRFVKNPARSESTGLGLALVKQIVERYGMTIDHSNDEWAKLHSFIIRFPD